MLCQRCRDLAREPGAPVSFRLAGPPRAGAAPLGVVCGGCGALVSLAEMHAGLLAQLTRFGLAGRTPPILTSADPPATDKKDG